MTRFSRTAGRSLARALAFAALAALVPPLTAFAHDDCDPVRDVRPAQLAQGPGHAGHGAAHPATAPATGLSLSPAWTRATPPGAKVAGGYLTIENKGAAPDRLIGGSVEAAGAFEVHEMAMEGGVMKMRALDKGLAIPAGGKVEMKPGGFHLMFLDLKRPIAAGESVKGELVFEKAGKVPVEFKAAAIGARGPDAGHQHH